MLDEHRDTLDRISTALLERETLESHELKLLVEGKPLPALPRPPDLQDRYPPPARARSGGSLGRLPRRDKLPDPEPVPG